MLVSHPSCSLKARFLVCSLLCLLAPRRCLGCCEWLEMTAWKSEKHTCPAPMGVTFSFDSSLTHPISSAVSSMNAGSLSQVMRCLFLLLVQQCRSQALQWNGKQRCLLLQFWQWLRKTECVPKELKSKGLNLHPEQGWLEDLADARLALAISTCRGSYLAYHLSIQEMEAKAEAGGSPKVQGQCCLHK